VKDKLGDPKGALVVDETGFLKKGEKSAGVMRQYSGTAGRVENCQVGVFLTYSSKKGFAAIDRELYLPKEWMDDKFRSKEAGIPEGTIFKTKPQMALKMMQAAYYDSDVPFSWVTADSVYGDYRDIGMWLESIQKGYVMAVSGKAYVWTGFSQFRISTVLENLPEDGWMRLSAGEGSKGERLYDWLLLPLNSPPQEGFKRGLLVRKSIIKPSESSPSFREDKTKSENLRAFICFYPESALIEELVNVAGIRWTVEQSFEEAKGEVGLDHYEVRSYSGWYKHITLSSLALALLASLKIRTAESDFQAAVDVDQDVSGMVSGSTVSGSTVSGILVSGSLDAFKKGRGL
jgi:SRSO17 transposase